METENTEIEDLETDDEIPTTDGLFVNALQDLILGNKPDELVTEFINDFVLVERPETPQILALFEMPNETIVQTFEGFCQHSFEVQKEAIRNNGAAFIEKLKFELKHQLEDLAA